MGIEKIAILTLQDGPRPLAKMAEIPLLARLLPSSRQARGRRAEGRR